MNTISVTIHDDWPRIKLVLTDGQGGFRTESAMYDTALTIFEPIVRNTVQAAVQQIIKRRRQYDVSPR